MVSSICKPSSLGGKGLVLFCMSQAERLGELTPHRGVFGKQRLLYCLFPPAQLGQQSVSNQVRLAFPNPGSYLQPPSREPRTAKLRGREGWTSPWPPGRLSGLLSRKQHGAAERGEKTWIRILALPFTTCKSLCLLRNPHPHKRAASWVK